MLERIASAGDLPALTVHQPWAELIAAGAKRVENRSWRTGVRGPIAIHAASRTNAEAWSAWLLPYVREAHPPAADFARLRPAESGLPFGAIVAVAELVDIVPASEAGGDPLAWGPWCWRLSGVVRIGPIRVRGTQRVWRTPAHPIRAALASEASA